MERVASNQVGIRDHHFLDDYFRSSFQRLVLPIENNNFLCQHCVRTERAARVFRYIPVRASSLIDYHFSHSQTIYHDRGFSR